MDAAARQLSLEDLDEIFARGTELVAAIVQDNHSGEILMLAWMNREALGLTLTTRQGTYWSRSRKEIWVKGATSGNRQAVKSVSVDCDGDALLVKVEQTGAACHTGQRSCFHRSIELQP